MPQPNEPQISATTFKYKNSAWVFFGLACLIAALGVLDVISIRQHDMNAAVLMSFFFVLVTLISVVSVLGLADVAVDDQGISRFIFGKRCQSIRWDNVEKVRSVSMPSFQGKKNKGIGILAKRRERGNWVPRGLVSFNENIQNIDDLIRLLNFYISKYKIPVEIITSEGKTPASHI